MNREQFLIDWRYLLRRGQKEAADALRRQHNRQIMAQYEERTKLSVDFVETADEVFIERGRRKYYAPMEE